MKLIPYFIYLLLIGFHDVIGRDVTSIYGCSINISALVVLLVAYYKSEVAAAWFGLAVGLVVSAGRPELLGWTSGIFVVIVVVAYNVKDRLNLDSMYARLLLVFGGVLVVNTLMYTQTGGERFWLELATQILPGAVYTTVVGWLFFLVKDGHLTYQKTKSIF